MALYIHQAWPAWRYGPNGAEAIFEREEDVPAGWVEHPSLVKEAPAEPPKKAGRPKKAEYQPPLDEERKARIAALRVAGAEIADDATDAEIEAALDALEKAEE